MSPNTWYWLCRFVVMLRHRGMTDEDLRAQLMAGGGLDPDEVTDLMDLTR